MALDRACMPLQTRPAAEPARDASAVEPGRDASTAARDVSTAKPTRGASAPEPALDPQVRPLRTGRDADERLANWHRDRRWEHWAEWRAAPEAAARRRKVHLPAAWAERLLLRPHRSVAYERYLRRVGRYMRSTGRKARGEGEHIT